MHLTSILGALVLSVGLLACGGGGGDCESLCTEAQAGQCTSITGNCGNFCDSLDAVDGPSNCTSQRSAYETCLGVGANVCDTDCDSQETALANCVGTYCSAHAADADCQVLIASF